MRWIIGEAKRAAACLTLLGFAWLAWICFTTDMSSRARKFEHRARWSNRPAASVQITWLPGAAASWLRTLVPAKSAPSQTGPLSRQRTAVLPAVDFAFVKYVVGQCCSCGLGSFLSATLALTALSMYAHPRSWDFG